MALTLLSLIRPGILLGLLLVVWLVPHEPIHTAVRDQISQRINQIPTVKVDWRPSETFRNRFSNKTVLYIETSDTVKHVTPLLLHMAQVVPPEWRFVFIGSDELGERVSRTGQAKLMQEIGKLRVENVAKYTQDWPEDNDNDKRDTRTRLLTNMTFYDTALPGVENLMTFESTTILCANAKKTVNDYLQYSWVGAPWNINDKFGGNGGLSIRQVSKIREVLSFQEHYYDSEVEDKWFVQRIGLLPNTTLADGTVEASFSVESIWQEQPLGYVVPRDMNFRAHPEVWGSHERRQEIFSHCPEIKMILPMRLEREKCPPPQ